MRHGMVVVMLGALLLALVAGSARADVIQIKIEKLAFTPAQVSAHVGDTLLQVFNVPTDGTGT
jgi:plastocyanin